MEVRFCGYGAVVFRPDRLPPAARRLVGGTRDVADDAFH